MTVKIYSTKSCPWCQKTKEFLKKKKVKFKNIDVGASQKAAQEMIKRFGEQRGLASILMLILRL